MNLDKHYNISDPYLFPLVLSKKFIKVLKSVDDIVSREILNLLVNRVRLKESFIDMTNKDDIITFISSDKINKMIVDKVPDVEDLCWTSSQRIEIKLGRMIFRLVGDKVQCTDIENFVNEYKSIIHNRRLYRNFKIIKGEELKKWYLKDNYSEGGGNLKDSCMGHKFCQPYLDFYTNNSNKVKMLILLDDTKEKILGRALLWTLDRPRGEVFMDRIYFSKNFVLNMFINHAIKNKWLYKLENLDNTLQVVKDNKIIRTTMIVKLKKEKHEYFPFVDNLGFYDPNTSTLTNNPKFLKSLGCDEYYDLCDHIGGYKLRTDFDF